MSPTAPLLPIAPGDFITPVKEDTAIDNDAKGLGSTRGQFITARSAGSDRVIGAADLSVLVFSGNLLNQADNASPELGVLDAHEGFRERKPIRRGEEVGDIGGRRRFIQSVRLSGQGRCAFEEEWNRDFQD